MSLFLVFLFGVWCVLILFCCIFPFWSLFCLFIVWMHCFGNLTFFVMVIGSSPCETLVSLFLVFLFGVWYVFNLCRCIFSSSSLFCWFVVWMRCFGSSSFLYCFNHLFWWFILFVLLIGHSVCETLVLLVFSFGVWCVFNLFGFFFFFIVVLLVHCLDALFWKFILFVLL